MFGSNNGSNGSVKSGSSVSKSINIIGVDTKIDGKIKSDSDIRIDGYIKGSVFTQSKVVVGDTGAVQGDITCQNADISGEIKGTITSAELLTLKSTAHVIGDIITNKLVIESGAEFNGNCQMAAVVSDKIDETEIELESEGQTN
ncbi:MAG: polymer-forming cytoskeletal protein [Bacteroidetes bacterium]|nr:polymer-forming cytoskeletal protein [Bacteroidota bacterium]